jgi:hypothetical protein
MERESRSVSPRFFLPLRILILAYPVHSDSMLDASFVKLSFIRAGRSVAESIAVICHFWQVIRMKFDQALEVVGSLYAGVSEWVLLPFPHCYKDPVQFRLRGTNGQAA